MPKSSVWFTRWIYFKSNSAISSFKRNAIKSLNLQERTSSSEQKSSRPAFGTRPFTKPGLKSFLSFCPTSSSWRKVWRSFARQLAQTKLSYSKGAPFWWSRTTMQWITRTCTDSRRYRTSSSNLSSAASRLITSSRAWLCATNASLHSLMSSLAPLISWSSFQDPTLRRNSFLSTLNQPEITLKI